MDSLFRTYSLNFLDLIYYEDIVLPKGAISFIKGESGCGKSTLLKIFNASISPKSGEVFFKDKNINKIDTIELRRKVSLVSQEVFLFDKTVVENFNLLYNYRKLPQFTNSAINKYLSICMLDGFSLDKDTTSMSGGERQRLYTAMFLSFKPEVLLLDEPTANLDNITGESLISNITEFCKMEKIELIIVSHDTNIVERYCENLVVVGKKAGASIV